MSVTFMFCVMGMLFPHMFCWSFEDFSSMARGLNSCSRSLCHIFCEQERSCNDCYIYQNAVFLKGRVLLSCTAFHLCRLYVTFVLAQCDKCPRG